MQPPLSTLWIALALLIAPTAASAQVDVRLIRPNVMVCCGSGSMEWRWTSNNVVERGVTSYAPTTDVTADVHIVRGLIRPNIIVFDDMDWFSTPLTPEETARRSQRMRARGIEAFDWPVVDPTRWEASLFDSEGSWPGAPYDAYARACVQHAPLSLTQSFWRDPLTSYAPPRRSAATRVVFDEDTCAGPFGAPLST